MGGGGGEEYKRAPGEASLKTGAQPRGGGGGLVRSLKAQQWFKVKEADKDPDG